MSYEKYNERHSELIKRLNSHSERINHLEINDAKMGEKIQSLIDKVGSLTAWIKALVMLGTTTLVSFFIWYIQSLGGK